MIKPIEKQRGDNKLINRLVQMASERCTDIKNQTIGIAHADDEARAENLMNKMKDRLGDFDVIVNRIGCVLTAHLGVGGVGLFFRSG